MIRSGIDNLRPPRVKLKYSKSGKSKHVRVAIGHDHYFLTATEAFNLANNLVDAAEEISNED